MGGNLYSIYPVSLSGHNRWWVEEPVYKKMRPKPKGVLGCKENL